MTAYDIIIRPIITERAMAGAADKKYVFEVAKTAGKVEIKKIVEHAQSLGIDWFILEDETEADQFAAVKTGADNIFAL